MKQDRNATIHYAKIRKNGRWGVQGYGLAEGQVVTVFKRGGGVETETVGELVFTFKNGASLHEIAGRTAAGPRGKGNLSHVFTAPRDEEQYAD